MPGLPLPSCLPHQSKPKMRLVKASSRPSATSHKIHSDYFTPNGNVQRFLSAIERHEQSLRGSLHCLCQILTIDLMALLCCLGGHRRPELKVLSGCCLKPESSCNPPNCALVVCLSFIGLGCLLASSNFHEAEVRSVKEAFFRHGQESTCLPILSRGHVTETLLL